MTEEKAFGFSPWEKDQTQAFIKRVIMLQAQRSWGIKSRWQKCNSMGRWLGLTARGFVSVYLGWSLGICISHKYSFDYDTAALRTTFREPPLHSRNRDSPIAQLVKNLPAVPEILVWFLGQEDLLEKGKATHSSILAWRIPWTVVHAVTKSDTTEWPCMTRHLCTTEWP